jgi:hypothetical protein
MRSLCLLILLLSVHWNVFSFRFHFPAIRPRFAFSKVFSSLDMEETQFQRLKEAHVENEKNAPFTYEDLALDANETEYRQYFDTVADSSIPIPTIAKDLFLHYPPLQRQLMQSRKITNLEIEEFWSTMAGYSPNVRVFKPLTFNQSFEVLSMLYSDMDMDLVLSYWGEFETLVTTQVVLDQKIDPHILLSASNNSKKKKKHLVINSRSDENDEYEYSDEVEEEEKEKETDPNKTIATTEEEKNEEDDNEKEKEEAKQRSIANDKLRNIRERIRNRERLLSWDIFKKWEDLHNIIDAGYLTENQIKDLWLAAIREKGQERVTIDEFLLVNRFIDEILEQEEELKGGSGGEEGAEEE